MIDAHQTIAFRESRRAYGTRIPMDEVSAHIACGWKVIDDYSGSSCNDGSVLMRAPNK